MIGLKKTCAYVALVVAVTIVIAGCTSSTTNSTQTAMASSQMPVANAGLNQTIAVGKTVTLDGSGSSSPSGRALAYDWLLISSPTNSSAQIANSSSAHPTFTPDKPGSYVAQLVVTDAAGARSLAAKTTVTGIRATPSKTTLTVKPPATELWLGQQQIVSGRLTDEEGNGIPNQTINLKAVGHVLGFTTDLPVQDVKTDDTGAFTHTETVSRQDAPSFITQLTLETWAEYGGNELYAPSSSTHSVITIHLAPPSSS